MSDKEELWLEHRKIADLASLQERREATLASIAEVEATYKAVNWTLNNKWLGLKDTLRRLNEMIKELEGVCVLNSKTKCLEFDCRESNRLLVKPAGGGGKASSLPPHKVVKGVMKC